MVIKKKRPSFVCFEGGPSCVEAALVFLYHEAALVYKGERGLLYLKAGPWLSGPGFERKAKRGPCYNMKRALVTFWGLSASYSLSCYICYVHIFTRMYFTAEREPARSSSCPVLRHRRALGQTLGNWHKLFGNTTNAALRHLSICGCG